METTKKEHKTAAKMLKAAKEVFLEKGFKGTSINDIATQANINKSLIYHHFKNKEGLWKAVKRNILESHTQQDVFHINFPMTSFKDFLQALITLRFELYDKNPDMARLIAWERLEKERKPIQGVLNQRLSSFVPQIQEFQGRDEVRPELNPEMVSYLLMTTPTTPFHQTPTFFQGRDAKKHKKQYLEMLIECLYRALSP